MQRLYPLARCAALLRHDERDLVGVGGIADVDDVHTVVLTGLAAPRGQVGEAVEDTHVGDLFGHDVLQPQFADQLDIRARRGQVTRRTAVLVMVTGDLGVIEGPVVAGRPVVRGRRHRQRHHCGDGHDDHPSSSPDA
ncbi:MAG: hypothetical protein ACRD0V_20340 [Acidimicrobiales bacterium]